MTSLIEVNTGFRGFSYVVLVVVTACSRTEAADVQPTGRSVYQNGIHSFVPANGYVPDTSTASQIAEVILIPIYGSRTVESERPFRATLRGNVWHVVGTLEGEGFGGVAIVEISKADGRILRVSHGM